MLLGSLRNAQRNRVFAIIHQIFVEEVFSGGIDVHEAHG